MAGRSQWSVCASKRSGASAATCAQLRFAARRWIDPDEVRGSALVNEKCPCRIPPQEATVGASISSSLTKTRCRPSSSVRGVRTPALVGRSSPRCWSTPRTATTTGRATCSFNSPSETARDRNDMLGAVLNAYGRPTIYSQTSYLSESKIFEQGQLRVIFFLEKSPFELRSVVEFLNKHMERSEVLRMERHRRCGCSMGSVPEGIRLQYEGRPTRPVWALDGRHVTSQTPQEALARCARSPRLAPRRRRRSSSPAGSCVSRMSRAMAATSSSSR